VRAFRVARSAGVVAPVSGAQVSARITIPLRAGTTSDQHLRKLARSGQVFPVKVGEVSWPHAVVVNYRTYQDPHNDLISRVEYIVERIEACSCGKPMHPLPFTCDDCMAFAFKVGT
jgi:hypothetical protein